MSKNIEINIKTENGYEVLYPKSTPEQVGCTTQAWVEEYVSSNYLSLSGGTMTGIINMGAQKITNVGAPAADTDVARLGDVRAEIAGDFTSASSSTNATVLGEKTFLVQASDRDGTTVNLDAPNGCTHVFVEGSFGGINANGQAVVFNGARLSGFFVAEKYSEINMYYSGTGNAGLVSCKRVTSGPIPYPADHTFSVYMQDADGVSFYLVKLHMTYLKLEEA